MQSTTAWPSWYRPTRGLAMAITILLGVQTVLLAALGLAYMARVRLLDRITGGEFVTHAQAQLADRHVREGAGLWLLVFIATGVVWLVWQHRAQANAQHLTTKKLMFSPGWAVGWWFIPFASLVQPFRAVRELWQESGGASSMEEGTWPVLALWWIAWLGFNLLSLNLGASADSASALKAADGRRLVALLLGIASAAFAIAIVRAVVRRQESRMRLWQEPARAQIPLPPPPPPGPHPE